ncbi:hypothetical protein LINGRAHAP2_LOCUS32782 [Linum grandiflorum]
MRSSKFTKFKSAAPHFQKLRVFPGEAAVEQAVRISTGEADVRLLHRKHNRLPAAVLHPRSLRPGFSAVERGDPAELYGGGGGGRVRRRQDRILQRGPRRRGAVRRSAWGAGALVLAGERAAPPRRGGEVGFGFRGGEVKGRC